MVINAITLPVLCSSFPGDNDDNDDGIYNVKSWQIDLIQMGECLFCNGKISHIVLPVWWLAVVAWTFLASGRNQYHDLSTLQYKCKN
jgi:hypothetical protein